MTIDDSLPFLFPSFPTFFPLSVFLLSDMTRAQKTTAGSGEGVAEQSLREIYSIICECLPLIGEWQGRLRKGGKKAIASNLSWGENFPPLERLNKYLNQEVR